METWVKQLQESITSPGKVTRRFGVDPRPSKRWSKSTRCVFPTTIWV